MVSGRSAQGQQVSLPFVDFLELLSLYGPICFSCAFAVQFILGVAGCFAFVNEMNIKRSEFGDDGYLYVFSNIYLAICFCFDCSFD